MGFYKKTGGKYEKNFKTFVGYACIGFNFRVGFVR